MPTLVMLVLEDQDKLPEVMAAWRAAGSYGSTILESSGAAKLDKALGARDDLPIFAGLRNIMAHQETHSRTLFTVLSDDIDVAAFFDATEKVTGLLATPNSGIIFAVPVIAARGHERNALPGD